MKRYSSDFKCPLCGNQVYIVPGEEGFHCDSHGLIPPIPKNLATLEEVYKELQEVKNQQKELLDLFNSHECQCSKKEISQGDL